MQFFVKNLILMLFNSNLDVMIMQNLPLIITSIILSFVSVKTIQSYFLKNDILDSINPRSSHSVTATRSGGIALASSLVLISIFYYLNNNEIFEFSLLVPLVLMVIVGLYDDIYNVDFKLKFIFQVIAAKIIIDNGLILDNLHGIFGIYELSSMYAQLISIFIIVSIINSFNFIDGIDGLASAITILFIIMFEYFSKYPTPFIYISIIIICSLIPVIINNYNKNNKVFLGDSGSLFLGTLISIYIMHILSNSYIIQKQFDVNKILYVLGIYAYPTIDFIRVIVMRLIKGKSPFQADKKHIHHNLITNGMSHLTAVCLILISSILLMLIIQLIF